MTIPKIEHVAGDRNTEYITLMCTGCNEYYSYSVRQYKGDFGCNISEFEQFLQWARWEAARHDCFLAGRVGYLPPDFFEGVERGVEALNEGRVTPWEGDDTCPTCGKPSELFVDDDCPECNPPVPPIADEFIFSGDSPGVRAEREAFERTFPGSLDFHPPTELERHASQPEKDPLDIDYGPPYAESDEDLLGGMFPERHEDPWGEEAMRGLREFGAFDATGAFALLGDDVQGGYWPDEFDDEDYYESADLDDDEPFSFSYGSLTDRLREQARDPRFVFELQEMPPRFEGKTVYIEFDYADLEQRIVDEEMVKAGIYYYDVRGNLRDEKGRCLACLRHGVHR